MFKFIKKIFDQSQSSPENTDLENAKDRRAHPRYHANQMAQIKIRDQEITCKIANISFGGARVENLGGADLEVPNVSFGIGQPIGISIESVGVINAMIVATSRNHIHIQFKLPDIPQQEALLLLIDQLESSGQRE